MRRGALTLLCFTAPALAASPADAGDPGLGGMLRVLASLAVVIGLIFGASALLRRVQRGTRAGGRLRSVESIAVGLKERVVLVDAGGTQLLLGVAPGRVRTLHVFDTPLAPRAAEGEAAASFRGVLAQLRGAAS